MVNRFRNPTMRREYDAAMRAYLAHHKDLFRSGQQFVGSTFAEFFWKGFNGIKVGVGFADKASREMIAYAYYRAGQDAARAKCNEPALVEAK